MDSGFRVASFGNALEHSNAAIVHVASHGVFGGSYGESFLLASDGRISIDRLEAQIRARRGGDEPIDLLTLSACQTAVGDQRAALGLAGVALKAGARSALASLWSVSDDATATLMARFYDELAVASVSKAEALRRAQLALLNDDVSSHPAFWSGFLMIGEAL